MAMERNDKIQASLRLAADLTLRIREARQSPLGLYRLLFSDEMGNPVIIKWFHEEWNELIMNHRLVQIEAARELTKTSFMLAAVLWLIGTNPNIRIKWLGENDTNASKRLGVIHSFVDNSQLYKQIFPKLQKCPKSSKRPNNTSMLNLIRNIETPEATIEALGVLTAGTGSRTDTLVLDDVVGESNAILNPANRPKVVSKVLSDWLGTLTANGRVWCIFSPWHNEDVNAYLKKNAGWTYKKYAHGKPSDPFHSIFPERWPRDKLIERRRWFGELIYARAYLCMTLSKDTIIVQPEHLRPYTTHLLSQNKLQTARALISIDPASGKQVNQGNLDYIGFSVHLHYQEQQEIKTKKGSIFRTRHEIFIPEAFQIKCPIAHQAKLAWQLAHAWQADTILVESSGMESLSVWLEQERQQDLARQATEVIPVQLHNQGKGQRLQAVTPLLNPPPNQPPIVYFHPKVITPNPQPDLQIIDGEEYETLCPFRDQALSFPTRHDDVLDSITQGLRYIHLNWIRPVEEEENEDIDYDNDQDEDIIHRAQEGQQQQYNSGVTVVSL